MKASGPGRARLGGVPGTVLIAVALLLLAGLGIIFQNERTYRAQKVNEVRVQAEILAASVTAALDFADAGAATEAVKALAANPQITAAGVYDRDGTLFAAFERSEGFLPRRAAPGVSGRSEIAEAEVPVARGGSRIGTVYLAAISEPLSRRLTRYLMIGLLVVMAALVMIVLGIAQAALRAANRELADRATALGEAYDELQVQVEERAKAEEQLRQAQKMQALGQLTGGIAHDFNNLLTVIQGSADILRRPNLQEEKRIRFADAIVQSSGRAAALTSQLLSFARRQPLQPELVDLNAMILGMTDLLDRTLGERIAISTDLSPSLGLVKADPIQLEAALLNIAVNARDAMPDGGALSIRTFGAEPLPDGRDAIGLAVSDTGTGVDAEALERVFEPFFTTKSVGKGTGLGLSQVYGFATQSGGDVDIASEPGKGTIVTIILPSAGDEARAAPDSPVDEVSASRSTGATGRILLVDDNDEVGAFAENMLIELGHRVVRARTGAEALELAKRETVDVVFTDVVMPGMSGLELAEHLRAARPSLPIVLTTGYSDEINTSGAGGLPVIYKPYRLDALAAILHELLTRPAR